MPIPLPALDVQPPRPLASPLEEYGQAVALKNALAQQQMIPGQLQLQQQSIQKGGMENELLQRQIADQKAVMDAMAQVNAPQTSNGQQASGGSSPVAGNSPDFASSYFQRYENMLSGLQGKVTPQTMAGLVNQYLEGKQKYLAMDSTQLDILQKKYSQLGGLIEQAKQDSPEDYVQKWPLYAQRVNALGIPGAQLDPAKPVDQQHLDAVGAGLLTASNMVDAAKFEHEKAGIPGAQAESQLKTNEAEYQALLQKATQNGLGSLTPQEVSKMRAYEFSQRKTTSQSDTLGVTSTNTSGPSGLASVSGRRAGAGAASQSAQQGIVDEIGQYKMNPMLLSRMMYKHPEIIGLVSQKYPDFDQTNYEAKQKALVGFTSGPQSKQINATNVALSHAGVAADAIGNLNNTDMKVWNRLANAVGVQVGQTPKTTFQAIIHKLGPELAQAYIAGGGGEAERQGILKDFDPSLSPEQLRSNLSTVVNLLRPNIDTLKQQYANTVGRNDFEQRFLTPEAQKRLQQFSGQGAGQPQQQHAPGKQASLPEGTTGKGSDGKRYVVKGGVWVPQQ